jgi:lipid II isoglutaminyl synthase (glutamine-hydrolysing)
VTDYKPSPSDQLAILAGKLSATTIRFLGAGMGSNLPGRFARKLSSHILADLSSQPTLGSIAVTGTNGKSTTSGLLSSILRTAGYRIVHNRQGANLVTGITASLVDAADWHGRIEADYGLYEIDEAALPVVAKEIKINTVLVTNLFRDQLDRFGELDTTAKLIAKGIEQNDSTAILNSDDPNVCQLKKEGKKLHYGIESLESCNSEPDDLAELSYCTKCGAEIAYSSTVYGQLGKWYCSNCDYKRPSPDVFASDVVSLAATSQFVLNYGNSKIDIHLTMPGLFNVYNAIAASAAALSLGVSIEGVQDGLKEYTTLFGRSERIELHGKSVIIQLIKNPAGATQTARAVSKDPNGTVLIAINDNLADGRDISWLWDADFEALAQLSTTFIVSGQRAEDMALRLKYAGVDVNRIKTVTPLEKALNAALTETTATQTLWVLPTYTCLLELEKIIKRHGVTLGGT